MATEAFLVRFRGATGIADSDWLKLAPGVSVVTGRNNVGKSRVLKSIGDLPAALNSPGASALVPEVRIEASKWNIETDIRITVMNGIPVGPASYAVLAKDGGTHFQIHWAPEPQRNVTVVEYEGPTRGSAQIGLGSVLRLADMSYLLEQQDVISSVGRLIYIPPERPVKAQHPANPVPVPKPDGSDLPQALYNHIANVTKQSAELEEVFFDMFPEVGDIIVAPLSGGAISLRLRDRFANNDISLDDVGTGLARMLHLIACVLLYEPGRIFLIDEPTTHLHPGSEKVLAAFVRKHSEHDYVISTHSPIFINAIQPDRAWLMVRDDRGSVIQPAFSEQAGRRHVFQELGVSAGDIAIAERLLFVEGLTDRLVYPIILGKLGWDLVAFNCEVIDLLGAEVASPLQQAVDQLTAVINVRYLIYLDGDKAGRLKGKWVKYLPLPEIEDLFLRDPAAIHAGFQEIIGQEHPKLLEAWKAEWPVKRIAEYLSSRQKTDKGKKVLIDLAHEMNLEYRPAVYGPAIARAMDLAHLEFLREDFRGLFE